MNFITKGIIASVSSRYGSAITHCALRILYARTMNLFSRGVIATDSIHYGSIEPINPYC